MILMLSLLAPVTAQTECVSGDRARTPEETAFVDRLSDSLKAAMPAAPAPLRLESEPQVRVPDACSDTPMGHASAMVSADYAAGPSYDDRVKVTLRANYRYPDADDLVLGKLPQQPSGFKVHNLVVKVDGYKAQYVNSLRQALDLARLQVMIDEPLPAAAAPPAWSVQAAEADTPAASSGGSPPAAPAKTTTDQAREVVNKLRGLFGR